MAETTLVKSPHIKPLTDQEPDDISLLVVTWKHTSVIPAVGHCDVVNLYGGVAVLELIRKVCDSSAELLVLTRTSLIVHWAIVKQEHLLLFIFLPVKEFARNVLDRIEGTGQNRIVAFSHINLHLWLCKTYYNIFHLVHIHVESHELVQQTRFGFWILEMRPNQQPKQEARREI